MRPGIVARQAVFCSLAVIFGAALGDRYGKVQSMILRGTSAETETLSILSACPAPNLLAAVGTPTLVNSSTLILAKMPK